MHVSALKVFELNLKKIKIRNKLIFREKKIDYTVSY